jgi:hypothetical protein
MQKCSAKKDAKNITVSYPACLNIKMKEPES